MVELSFREMDGYRRIGKLLVDKGSRNVGGMLKNPLKVKRRQAPIFL